MVAQEENAAAPRQAGGAIHAIAHAAAQTKPSQSESESASPGPNVYLIGNVVHNDRGGCPPVIHGRQAAVSLLPGRIPYLELHRRLIELHLLRQERGWVGPIRARRQQSGVDQWRQRKQHRRRSSSSSMTRVRYHARQYVYKATYRGVRQCETEACCSGRQSVAQAHAVAYQTCVLYVLCLCIPDN